MSYPKESVTIENPSWVLKLSLTYGNMAYQLLFIFQPVHPHFVRPYLGQFSSKFKLFFFKIVVLGKTDKLVFCKPKSVKPFRSYACAKATHPKWREQKRPFLTTFFPQNTTKTLPKWTEIVKTRVLDAQDHEDSIFDDSKPLSLTILAQNEIFWDTGWPFKLPLSTFSPP